MKHPLYDMDRAHGEPPRWTATAWYRSEVGLVDVEHQIEELDMLHGLIESGPDWNTLDRIEIRLTRVLEPDKTIESLLP